MGLLTLPHPLRANVHDGFPSIGIDLVIALSLFDDFKWSKRAFFHRQFQRRGIWLVPDAFIVYNMATLWVREVLDTINNWFFYVSK